MLKHEGRAAGGRFAYFFQRRYLPQIEFFERKKSTYLPQTRPSGFSHTVFEEGTWIFRTENKQNLGRYMDQAAAGRTHRNEQPGGAVRANKKTAII